MRVTVLSGQSMLDLAIQTSGDATAAIDMAIAAGIPLTCDLVVGAGKRTVPVVNRDIANYYINQNLKPATAATDNHPLLAGIFDHPFDRPFE